MTEVADGTDNLKAWVKASFEAGITAAISTLGNVVDAELQKISKRIEPFELMGQAMEEELVPLRGLNAELVDTRVALQEQLANLTATVADHYARQKLCDIECVEALSPAAALISKSKARRMRRTNCAQQHQWSRKLLLTARNPAERDSTDIAAAALIPAGVASPAWPEQSSIEQRIHNLEVLAVASASHFAPVVPTPILADQSGTAGGHGAVEWGPWQSCTTYQEDWFASDAWEVLQQYSKNRRLLGTRSAQRHMPLHRPYHQAKLETPNTSMMSPLVSNLTNAWMRFSTSWRSITALRRPRLNGLPSPQL